MTHEWKPGDRAMVEIISVNSTGHMRLEGAENTYLPLRILHPLPPALTPEDAAVLNRADDWSIDPDDWKVARDLKVAIQRRVAARQSPPVPPESAAQPEATSLKVTELLYPLPDGSAVLLSQVNGINVTNETKKSFVYLALPGNIYKSIHFANADEAAAFADTIRDLVNAARSGKPYTRDTSAATEAPPAAPAFKVGDRVRVPNGPSGTVCGFWRDCLQFNDAEGARHTYHHSLLERCPIPDLSSLRDAVVEAAKAEMRALDDNKVSSTEFATLKNVRKAAVRALLAAEAPRDPVEDMERAVEIACSALIIPDSEGMVSLGKKLAADKLRAALAAMKERR